MTVPNPITYLLGPARYRVPVAAFAASLILTPVILAVLGGVLIVPLFAALMGLPAQILLGGPMAWIVAGRYVTKRGRISLGALAAGGFFANALSFPLALPVLIVLGWSPFEALEALIFYCTAGIIFAPLEGVIFGLVYRGLTGPAEPLAEPADIFN